MKYLISFIGCLVFVGCGSDYFPQDATCNGSEKATDGSTTTYYFKTVHVAGVVNYTCGVNGQILTAAYGDQQFIKTTNPSCVVIFPKTTAYFVFTDLSDTVVATVNNPGGASDGHTFKFQDSQCTRP